MEISPYLTALLFVLPVFGMGRLCHLLVFARFCTLAWLLLSKPMVSPLQKDISTPGFRTIIKFAIPITTQFVQQCVLRNRTRVFAKKNPLAS
jgi:hypothetical protein